MLRCFIFVYILFIACISLGSVIKYFYSIIVIVLITNYCQAQICSGNLGNAVFLEDFGSGSALYGPALPSGVTNYIYQTGNPPNGTYVISSSSNPSGVNLGYVNDGDHTGNTNGYMMVVNSDYPASEVYRKHVTGLCPNTTYVFSSFLSNNNTPTTPNNVCPGYVYANVKFQIEYPLGVIQNSVTTGNLPLGLSNTSLNWQQYGFVFTTTTGQTSVDIVLKNNAPGGCGNDYVVDDISLSPCGPGIALNVIPTQSVFCSGDTVLFQSSYTFGNYLNPQYQWQYSGDGGNTWINISGANSSSYSISNVNYLHSGLYQLLASENGNIASQNCRIVSGPISFSVDVNCNTSVANFSFPDTVCVNQSFSITNLCEGANTYYWNFCQGNTATTPQAINMGNVGNFNGPVFITVAKDGSDYYAFVTNNSISTITRLFFGSSLLNTPIATNLGNVGGVLPGNLEDIHLENENGNWYGIVVGGMFGGERIVRLNFGSSLSNIPTASNMGNIGGMSYPQRIKIFNNSGNYYGFVTNRDNNTITRFSFGNSLLNTPTGLNLGNIGGLNTPDALGLINVNNLWYGYVINEGNNTISRLDFGNSLLNIPTGFNLGNTGSLNGPRAIDVWTECDQIKGLITNRFGNDLLNMNFNAGPTGPVTTSNFGNIANFSFPHSITRFRSGDTLYAFITNVSNNTLSRIYFPNCTNSSIPSTTQANPNSISYNTPGNYYINVLINEGQINQASYCKQITVISTPTLSLSSQTICSGNSVILNASGALSYTWSSGVNTSSISVNPSNTQVYSVIGSNNTCSASASATVLVQNTPTISITASSQNICSGQSAILMATGAGNYVWSNGVISNSISVSPSVTTVYTVSSSSSNFCTSSSSISINVTPTPSIVSVLNQNTSCGLNNGSITINSLPQNNQYIWNPSVINPSNSVSNLSANNYSIQIINGSCITSTVINIQPSNPLIITSVSVNPSYCSLNNGQITIETNMSNSTYSWFPNISQTTGTLVGLSSQDYSVNISNTGCSTSTVINVPLQNPTIQANIITNPSKCSFNNGSIQVLNVSGGTEPYQFSIDGVNYTSQLIFNNLIASNYTLTVKDANDCLFQSSYLIKEIKGPSGFNTTSVNEYCEKADGSVVVTKITGGTPPYEINFNGLGYSSVLSYSNLSSSNYNISIKDANECVYSKTVFVKRENVYVKINTELNTAECGLDNGSLNVVAINGGTPPYLLNFNSLGYSLLNSFDNLSPTSYVLSVKDASTCVTNFTITIPETEEATLFIPNSFTPNKDDLNDVWGVKGLCVEEFTCAIYNRWGEKIKELNNISETWDGTYKGSLAPNDVYVYIINVMSPYKKENVKTGHILLLK